VVLTADEAILQLDNVLRNDAGNLMRCYDSDDVLGVL
jgi:hypothetical protein